MPEDQRESADERDEPHTTPDCSVPQFLPPELFAIQRREERPDFDGAEVDREGPEQLGDKDDSGREGECAGEGIEEEGWYEGDEAKEE